MREADIIAVAGSRCPRSPTQWNALHGSDAELVPVGREVIGLSTDVLSEEIDLGVFTDPELLGWISVATSLSDLAAAGCDPCGVLNLLTVPAEVRPEWLDAFFRGVADCCATHGTAVIGGDTNIGPLRAGSTALGRPRHQIRNPRLQAAPGHDLYAAGFCGHGNRLAYAQLTRHALRATLAAAFRPRVDFQLGALALELGGSGIDTSDGVVPTLATLLGLQPVAAGAVIDAPPDDVGDFARAAGLSPLAFLLGEVGDYGLLLTLPVARSGEFRQRAAGLNLPFPLRRIGRITAEPVIQIEGTPGYRWPVAALLADRGDGGDASARIAATLRWLEATYRT